MKITMNTLSRNQADEFHLTEGVINENIQQNILLTHNLLNSKQKNRLFAEKVEFHGSTYYVERGLARKLNRLVENKKHINQPCDFKNILAILVPT